MRTPKYLSPTSIGLWQKDVGEFYERYLSDYKQQREPQTQPMSIGSAFDAFAKSYLHESLFGRGADSQYTKEALFEAQVDPHNRDWAWHHGELVFKEYKDAGCLADLMLELNQAVGDPRFEFSINDVVDTQIGEIPLLGKPDIFFVNSLGARVILDWKVNGYCSPRTTSPMKGYVKLRPGDKMHKTCELIDWKGIKINGAIFLEEANSTYADQLSIYSWLLGEPFGSEEMVTGIDQIVGPCTKLRFATHRCRISPDYQFELLALIEQIWQTIQSGHIFRDMTEEDSHSRQALLDMEPSGDSDFLERCF